MTKQLTGTTAAGRPQPLLVEEDGTLRTSASGGGGSSAVAQGAPTTAPATGAWPVKVVDAAGALLGLALDASVQAIAATLTNGTGKIALRVGGGDVAAANPVPVAQQGAQTLPAGASTAAAQTSGNASLASIDGKTPALVGGRQPVDGSGVTQPVSAAILPLPNGAATQATLANVASDTLSINTHITSIDAKMPVSPATAAAQGALLAFLQASTTAPTYLPPVTVGTTATALPSGAFSRGFTVQSVPANIAPITIGVAGVGANGPGIILQPGASRDYDLQNPALLQAVSTAAGQTLLIEGRP